MPSAKSGWCLLEIASSIASTLQKPRGAWVGYPLAGDSTRLDSTRLTYWPTGLYSLATAVQGLLSTFYPSRLSLSRLTLTQLAIIIIHCSEWPVLWWHVYHQLGISPKPISESIAYRIIQFSRERSKVALVGRVLTPVYVDYIDYIDIIFAYVHICVSLGPKINFIFTL